MDRRHQIAGAPEVKVAVRVRGLSHEPRYFDERTWTTRLTPNFIVIRLPLLVDLDFELHVMNMRTLIGAIYRVAWINTLPQQNLYSIGLELLEKEGEIWEEDSLSDGPVTEEAAPAALLECQQCHQRTSVTLPEVESESLGEGFMIS